MHDSITAATKARSKEKQAAKAAAAKKERALEELKKITVLYETRGSLLKQEKTKKQVATKKLAEEKAKNKKIKKELKTSNKKIAALRKQLAGIKKLNSKLSAATLVRQNTLA